MEDRPNGIYQCARRECPVYTTIREHVSDLEDFPENVTIRKVEAGLYAQKTSTKCEMLAARTDSFRPLHNYFYYNTKGVKMPRTLPILLFSFKMPDTLDSCDYTHQLNFYLPAINHTNYPEPPSESGIEVVTTEPRCYVVYHWFSKVADELIYRIYRNLKASLDATATFNLPFERETFVYASYDP
ncbi:SOUL family heme-binding protein, partial [Salmonella sp. s55004]|uniref:SOUL family heme-binding protein n=1 Tax=Salmonella sp. s55004 TaxID=3159675 RepID=UPI00398028AE